MCDKSLPLMAPFCCMKEKRLAGGWIYPSWADTNPADRLKQTNGAAFDRRIKSAFVLWFLAGGNTAVKRQNTDLLGVLFAISNLLRLRIYSPKSTLVGLTGDESQ